MLLFRCGPLVVIVHLEALVSTPGCFEARVCKVASLDPMKEARKFARALARAMWRHEQLVKIAVLHVPDLPAEMSLWRVRYEPRTKDDWMTTTHQVPGALKTL